MLDTMIEMQRRSYDEVLKTWGRWMNLPKVPEIAKRVAVATTPHDVVYEEDSLQLLHYRNEHSIDLAEPILVCYALVNRPYILDLQERRSVVRQLLKRGFDVYLIDWGVPTAADRTMRLNDYVCGLMKNCVDFVCEHAGSTQLNLLGYCMGGTMSTMFTTLYPEMVRNLILMAAPIDFREENDLLCLWTKEEYFDVDAVIDAFGNCPATMLQGSFGMMKPLQNYGEKYVNFFDKLYDDNFLENYFSMERWTNDNIPVAGETFREFVKLLYQRNMLIKGQMRLGERPIKLDRITCPLLMLVAEFDHLVSPQSTLALREHVSSQDITEMMIDVGHVGLAVSSKAHKKIWPEAAMWIADHSTVKH